MATEVRELRSFRTLNGLYDAYCRVCWNPVYTGWIDKEDHEGKCPLGHTVAHQCPDAMGRAKFAAAMQRHREQGLLKPVATSPSEGGREVGNGG